MLFKLEKNAIIFVLDLNSYDTLLLFYIHLLKIEENKYKFWYSILKASTIVMLCYNYNM